MTCPAVDAVLLAAPGTNPVGLLEQLGRHPEVAARPCVRLSGMLHGTAHGVIRALRLCDRATSPLDLPRVDQGTFDAVALARATSGAALSLIFGQLRRGSRRTALVVWDPDGLAFPFAEPPDIRVVLLYRDPVAVARVITAGASVANVARQIAAQVAAIEQRVVVWGIERGRVLLVDEEELAAPAAVRRLLAFLQVAHEPSLVDAFLRSPAEAGSTSLSLV